jgi:hypothetical protein
MDYLIAAEFTSANSFANVFSVNEKPQAPLDSLLIRVARSFLPRLSPTQPRIANNQNVPPAPAHSRGDLGWKTNAQSRKVTPAREKPKVSNESALEIFLAHSPQNATGIFSGVEPANDALIPFVTFTSNFCVSRSLVLPPQLGHLVGHLIESIVCVLTMTFSAFHTIIIIPSFGFDFFVQQRLAAFVIMLLLLFTALECI